MVSRQPHADVAILVLHGSDVGRETFVTSQGRPVRPEVLGRRGFPLRMLGVAPARAGSRGHAFSLLQPKGRKRIGGSCPRLQDDPSPKKVHGTAASDPHRPTSPHDIRAAQICDAHHCPRPSPHEGPVRHQLSPRPRQAHRRPIAAAAGSACTHTTTSPPKSSQRPRLPREHRALRPAPELIDCGHRCGRCRLEKPVRCKTLQELRHELQCPRSTWQAVDPDSVLAGGQLLVCQEAHRHQLVAIELAQQPNNGGAAPDGQAAPRAIGGSGQDRAVCLIRTV